MKYILLLLIVSACANTSLPPKNEEHAYVKDWGGNTSKD